jgi:hypothetical protein
MKITKRLVAYLMGISVPAVLTIFVWLFTFMSFNLFDVLHSAPFIFIQVITVLIWGIVITSIPYKDIEDMVS